MEDVKNNKKFNKILDSAEDVLDNNERVTKVLKKSINKAKSLKEHLSEFKENILLSVSLIKDWVKGDYREVPKKTIVCMVAALIYFVMPIDVIPDFFFKVGLIDDYAVLSYVFSSFIVDIEKYKEYKEYKELKKKEVNSKKEDTSDKDVI
jgi:uncharacterized membrane protein YkvA (DUF1232 family)